MNIPSSILFAIVLVATTEKIDALETIPPPPGPHIVFLLVDDWGWANVGYHRDPPTPEVSTPNIDDLLKNGVELDQHYVYRFCSPSRSSFLTGRLPIHVNDENTGVQNYNPKDPISGFGGIPRNMTSIADKLREAGYATHMVGKWHAGMATPDHIPTGRGFDTSFGYFSGVNDYYTQTRLSCNNTPIVDLWKNYKPAIGDNSTDYEEAMFKRHVMSIIENHDTSHPLFLYYAPHIAHDPLEVPKDYYDMFNFIDVKDRRKYHAMVKYLDDIVGNMTEALKKHGLWEDLLFVASADNGGPVFEGANNYPLKGGKLTDWQGGVRANAFVSGGYVPEHMRGQKIDGYIHIADWYATFCELAHVNPIDDKAAKAKLPPIDSLNVWPLISGESFSSPRTDVPISYKTLISGDYKILTGPIKQAGWTGPQNPNVSNPSGEISAVQPCGDAGCLYNIKEDPGEHNNLAKTNVTLLMEMQQRLLRYQATYFKPDRGDVWPGACEFALNKYSGFWGPFLP